MNTILRTAKKAEKDVFNAFLVKNATYDGEDEIPCITTSNNLPKKLISFSKAPRGQNDEAWVHFYEHDYVIERFWKKPRKYLPLLKRYKGVITPDYSVCYDMPLNMQKFNIYRGRAQGNWLNEEGVEIIPNVRWGDERTFETACLGIERGKTIAVGTHGCIKTAEGKQMFIEGFDYAINRLEPKNVVVYGRMPDKIFCLAKMYGIKFMSFESEFGLSHKKGVN